MGLDRTVAALEALRPVVKLVPVAGQYLEGAVDLLYQGCLHAQTVKSNRKATAALVERAVRCISLIAQKAQTMPVEEVTDQLDSIRELQELVNELVEKTGSRAKRSYLSALTYREEHREEIKNLSQRMDHILERFGVETHLTALGDMKQIKNIQMKSDQHALLEKLRPVSTARHDHQHAPRGCTKDTRVEVIDLIDQWAKDYVTPQSIFWLSGLAGTGKTAIMKTLSEHFAELGVLGACFFASINAADRRDPQNIVRSLAYQLAYYHPALREHICSAIREQPAVVDQTIELQVQKLLSKPIQEALPQITKPIVIMIDALDECNKIDNFEGGQLLPILLTLMSQCPEKLKLIITSRLTSSIKTVFETANAQSLKLHDIEESKVSCDIRQYLKAELERISLCRPTKRPRWYTDEDIDKLVDCAGSLFIYASTVVAWLDNPRFLPQTRLQQIIHLKKGDNSILPHKTLDVLYDGILQSTLGPDPDDHEQVRERIRALLEVLVSLFEPLSTSDLAALLGQDEDLVQLDLEQLSAVIVIEQQESTGAAFIYHASFIDYVTDTRRCTSSFNISTWEAHGKTGLRCFNIVYNKPTRLGNLGLNEGNISPKMFDYAKQNCYAHLERSHVSSGYIMKAIEEVRLTCLQYDDRRLVFLRDLSSFLHIQLEQVDDKDLLWEKISVDRQQMDLTPPGHIDRHHSLRDLGMSLHVLYRRTGDQQALEECVRLGRERIELHPPGHPERLGSLNNIAIYLHSLYLHTGNQGVLEESIQIERELLELHSPGDPDRHTALDNLGIRLHSFYKCTGDRETLEESIRLGREGLELCPPGHLKRHFSLNNLAVRLHSLYKRTGDQKLLHESIQLTRDALAVRPHGHPSRGKSLHDLAVYLWSLYESSRDADLLAEIIPLAREALCLCPVSHPDYSDCVRYLTDYVEEYGRVIGDEAAVLEAYGLFKQNVANA